jgi:6-phosphogluconolactonase
MEIEIFPDAPSGAQAAAVFIAVESHAAIAARGRFVAALSGGSTPWLMLRALAREEVRWDAVQVVRVDERIARAGDRKRNLTGSNLNR